MEIKISTALISVFSKDGLDPIIQKLNSLGVTIYSTGGTFDYITKLGVSCIQVEDITGFPSILGGRVKTLHPSVFGGILNRAGNNSDAEELKQFNIPVFDLVIVDLYPFQDTAASSSIEQDIIEKIDIGGVSLIRAAAKNFASVISIGSKNQYQDLLAILENQAGSTTLEIRKTLAAKAFAECADYDVAISNWFASYAQNSNGYQESQMQKQILRYGENPHQTGVFYGDIQKILNQIHGKELSYNNYVDIDAAIELILDFDSTTFAIIKHTNVCGIASRNNLAEAFKMALAGDLESAFGGVLIANQEIDKETANEINTLFIEVLLAPSYSKEALEVLKSKKNRILLEYKPSSQTSKTKTILNGVLVQNLNQGNFSTWEEKGARETTDSEKEDLKFANLVVKHLKSNAISIVKNQMLIGKGTGQTSRIDALKQAITKAKQFNHDLNGAVLASDAFFPFSDCAEMAHSEGIVAIIQPGGSIRDEDSIQYCQQNGMAMVFSSQRHFKH